MKPNMPPNYPDYPDDDSTKAPEGYRWRGQKGSKPGSRNGSYTNPETGETLNPDLDHDPPIGPHWDYGEGGKRGERKWRNGWIIFPDGSIERK